MSPHLDCRRRRPRQTQGPSKGYPRCRLVTEERMLDTTLGRTTAGWIHIGLQAPDLRGDGLVHGKERPYRNSRPSTRSAWRWVLPVQKEIRVQILIQAEPDRHHVHQYQVPEKLHRLRRRGSWRPGRPLWRFVQLGPEMCWGILILLFE